MTVIRFLGAFRAYGADVLLIALGVSLLTSLLKKTALKNCPKKIFVFLPFLLGTALYAVKCALVTMSAAPFTDDIAQTLEGGFACGCAANLYYVIYEQFFRGKSEAQISALTPLLQGYVPEEKREEAEAALLAGAAKKTGEELLSFVKETLSTFVEADLPESELESLCALVAKYLVTLGR